VATTARLTQSRYTYLMSADIINSNFSPEISGVTTRGGGGGEHVGPVENHLPGLLREQEEPDACPG
jgi:hypothetical protein